MNKVLFETKIPGLPPLCRGKARDTYVLPNDLLLMIATDRVSAFDKVLPNPIPDKGRVLNLMSAFWFEKTRQLVPNHLVAAVDNLEMFAKYAKCKVPAYAVGRSMVVKEAERLPVECVVRGFLAGSAWDAYQAGQSICGIKLPAGLVEASELPEPIFTPTTKAKTGHDQPLNFGQLVAFVGEDIANELKLYSIWVYEAAKKIAWEKEIIIADTKFEFGLIDGEIVLIDEVLTPDSSRFWNAETYEPGHSQESFDKQPLRDWLLAQGWKGEGPAPTLPQEIIQQTSERYLEAYRRLVGSPLPI